MKAPYTVSKPEFPADADTKEYAASLDAADPLRGLRDEFIIPSKANIACKRLAKPGECVSAPTDSSFLTSNQGFQRSLVSTFAVTPLESNRKPRQNI